MDGQNPLSDPDERLHGFQELCMEIGINPPPDSSIECQWRLQRTLVNIVDLVDARRTGKQVEVWDDYEAFCRYTLQPGKMFSRIEALEDGILESLLRRVRRNNHRQNPYPTR